MPSHQRATVKIKLGIHYLPFFGIYKWEEENFKTPLKFRIDDVDTQLFLEDPTKRFAIFNQRRNLLDILVGMSLVLIFLNPSPNFILGLRSKRGKNVTSVAQKIYKIYQETITKFEVLLRTKGGIKHLSDIKIPTIDGLFKKDYGDFPVSFSIDNATYQAFNPIFPRGHKRITPLFKTDQLITFDKWKNIQKAINEQNYPKQEIVELLRIRSKLFGKNKKIATLESAILFESLLRTYARKTLKEKNLSATKIKQLEDELSFNNILNLLLPLSLRRSQIEKLRNSINAVDRLRKTRNDVVHGEISEERIDEKLIEEGIKGGLKLLRVIIK